MKSDLFPLLSEISFAERDPAVIEREMIQGYENAYRLQYGEERKLYPGDPIRLFLEAVAFELVHQRQLIDHAAKMNLLAFSEAPDLDHLGANLGVTRLSARSALTALKFTLSEAQVGTFLIPAGTRATPGGGDIVFATTRAAEIPEGETTIEVPAECLSPGTAGNGFLPGQVRKIVDPFPWQVTVENVTPTSGGADVESDENFRERIQIAPESFSVAGPVGAYIAFARGASQLVSDVQVHSPLPGVVHVYPLLYGGELPTPDILALVYAKVNADDVRPTSDYVQVLSPVPVSYDLRAEYWIDRGRATQAAAIQRAVEQAAQDWALWQRSKLGRDINPSELAYRLVAAGAKRVEIASPVFTVLGNAQVAVAEGMALDFGGLEDG